MDDGQTEQMLRLLRTASYRQKSASEEPAAFNLLSALHIEHYETQTHSQIIFFLLNSNDCSGGQNTFLNLFLQILKIMSQLITAVHFIFVMVKLLIASHSTKRAF